MIDCSSIQNAMLSASAGSMTCITADEDELVMSAGLTYADGDHPELLVRAGAGGVLTVTDFGTAVSRLALSDVSFEPERVNDAIVAILRGYGLTLSRDGAVIAETNIAGIGQVILDATCAMLQIDALTALRTTPRGPQFGTTLTRFLQERLVGSVDPSPTARGSTGRTYRLTAAVGSEESSRVLIQAVAKGGLSADTRSLEHAFRVLYDVNHQVTPARKLAVLADSPQAYDDSDIALLEQVSYVGTWAERDRILEHIRRPVAQESRRLYDIGSGTFSGM